MTKISLTPPSAGEKDSAAEPKVTTAFKEIEKWLNEKNIESTDNLKKEGIAEESLSKALQEKLTTRLGFVLEKKNESFEAATEKHYQQEKAGATITLPKPTLNRIISMSSNVGGEGSCKVKASEGKIYGDFFTAGVTELTLIEGQHLIVLANGTNWLIIAGEAKREQKWEAAKAFTKAEMETGVEPSATRPAFVRTILELGTAEVGGVAIPGFKIGAAIYVPPGQKVKGTSSAELQWLLL